MGAETVIILVVAVVALFFVYQTMYKPAEATVSPAPAPAPRSPAKSPASSMLKTSTLLPDTGFAGIVSDLRSPASAQDPLPSVRNQFVKLDASAEKFVQDSRRNVPHPLVESYAAVEPVTMSSDSTSDPMYIYLRNPLEARPPAAVATGSYKYYFTFLQFDNTHRYAHFWESVQSLLFYYIGLVILTGGITEGMKNMPDTSPTQPGCAAPSPEFAEMNCINKYVTYGGKLGAGYNKCIENITSGGKCFDILNLCEHAVETTLLKKLHAIYRGGLAQEMSGSPFATLFTGLDRTVFDGYIAQINELFSDRVCSSQGLDVLQDGEDYIARVFFSGRAPLLRNGVLKVEFLEIEYPPVGKVAVQFQFDDMLLTKYMLLVNHILMDFMSQVLTRIRTMDKRMLSAIFLAGTNPTERVTVSEIVNDVNKLRDGIIQTYNDMVPYINQVDPRLAPSFRVLMSRIGITIVDIVTFFVDNTRTPGQDTIQPQAITDLMAELVMALV